MQKSLKFTRKTGVVSSLAPSLSYGTITTAENEIVFFHNDSLIGLTFDQLSLGSKLKFLVTEGPLGLQAANIVQPNQSEL